MQCPAPEDRLNAWMTGICDHNYACCFYEVNTTCCYTYGSTGPIKCCGLPSDHVFKIFGIIILVLFGLALLGLSILCICSCYMCCKQKSEESTPLYSVELNND